MTGGERSRTPVVGPRTSLREQVASAVRAALISGEMQPGVVYSAPALAARFGISATPVREALLDLAKEGLVEAVRNKGFRVSSLSDADLAEILDLRLLLEVPAVGRLATGGQQEELRQLRPLADAISQAAVDRNLLAYVEADQRFHLALLELTDNRRLVEIVRNLRAQARLHGLGPLAARGELAGAAQQHHDLLERLVAADAAGAEEIMRHHLAQAGEVGTQKR